MATPAALVVEDEVDLRELIELSLSGMDLDVVGVGTLAEAHEQLGKRSFALCLTDLRLPDGMSLPLVEKIGRDYPHTPVAVLTAYGNVETAVQALKAGAFDFVAKPLDISQLRGLVQTALRLAAGRPAVDASTRLIGESQPIQQARATIMKLARSQAPVYISGESGCGKELAARLIHELSPRAHGPFVPVNCGAIPAELLESEFFGHKKGSFTGANIDKPGLFQAAHGGTMLLDEVADLPLPMQVKLLRAIQEKAIRPIGAHVEQPVDVRIVSATHKNLLDLVQKGSFRQDLYYRINVIELPMPPLRQRREDIPALIRHILAKLDPDGRTRLSDDAVTALGRYDFPGNIRELENILERALALAEGNLVQADDLHLPASASASTPAPFAASAPAAAREPAAAPTSESRDSPLEDYIEQLERDRILKALEANRYNKTKTAETLGITFRALRYRLKKLGIE